jgi:hypothetical protein
MPKVGISFGSTTRAAAHGCQAQDRGQLGPIVMLVGLVRVALTFGVRMPTINA